MHIASCFHVVKVQEKVLACAGEAIIDATHFKLYREYIVLSLINLRKHSK